MWSMKRVKRKGIMNKNILIWKNNMISVINRIKCGNNYSWNYHFRSNRLENQNNKSTKKITLINSEKIRLLRRIS